MPASPSERPRYRIGRYAVIGRIGKGGMGMVYRAKDEALDRDVAVKTLTPVEGSLDPESRRRFEVEARAAARLQHPNIVTVFELAEDRGVPYIAMELLPGADLEALLRSGEELLLAEKLEVVVQVCRGLAYAHEHGVVHRDIKPSNIRLLDDGTAKIMDFGIAKLGSTTLTKTGMMVGTVHYMSPEQVRGRGVDGRSDVFSTGVILYELLAGRRPFRGEGATDVLYKIVHEAPEPLDVAVLGLDPRITTVVERALEKDADQRYPTAGALADALQAVLADLKREGVPAAAAEPLSVARRLLKEGRAEEGLTRLRTLAESTPTSIEVRRALRAATRQVQQKTDPSAKAAEGFPELDATFRAAPAPAEAPAPLAATVSMESPSTRLLTEEPRPGHSLGALLGVVGVLALVGLGVGAWLLRGRTGSEPSLGASQAGAAGTTGPGTAEIGTTGTETTGTKGGGTAGTAGATATGRTGPGPSGPARSAGQPSPRVILPVITDPPGASVTLDGQRVAGATPLDLSFDADKAHVVAISLDSYATHEVKLEAGQSKGELRLRLEPAEPLATVTVASSYPIDVSWRGRGLAKGEVSPRVQVPGGRQVLSVASPGHFVRAEIVVNAAPGGATSVDAPALGRVSVRANPDNCQVSIDGVFVDYPPILDKPVGAGSHVVSFKWPDGAETKETVEVQPGKVAFVTGRKG